MMTSYNTEYAVVVSRHGSDKCPPMLDPGMWEASGAPVSHVHEARDRRKLLLFAGAFSAEEGCGDGKV